METSVLSAVIHGARRLSIEEVAPVPLAPEDVLVKVGSAGICGSDLHYYLQGGFGAIRLKQPMILGHEIAGTVAEVGKAVVGLAVGTRVAVNPATPCWHCRYCREGMPRHCLNMEFLGSALPFPHIQGGFREYLTVRAENALPLAGSVSLEEAAMAEPLSVCLHAVTRAGDLLGKKVLVTGAGPVGCLCVLAARLAGAVEVVATDVNEYALSFARTMGATHTIDVAAYREAMARYKADKGHFDVMLEASGNEKAMRDGLEVLRACGILIQVGLGGDVGLPLNLIVSKEISIRGTFRFDREFSDAVELLNGGRVDVKPLHTHTFPLIAVTAAFDKAADRSAAMKVQLSFN